MVDVQDAMDLARASHEELGRQPLPYPRGPTSASPRVLDIFPRLALLRSRSLHCGAALPALGLSEAAQLGSEHASE